MPAPSEEHLREILAAGVSVPDHGGLRPFRFTLLRGDDRDRFGAVLEEMYKRRCHAAGEAADPDRARKERAKFSRAPVVIVVSALRRDDCGIPWSDQRDAAVCAAGYILLACHALGYGAMWRTGVAVDDEHVKAALGLAAKDAIVAFIYVGTPATPKPPKHVDPAPFLIEFPISPRS
jgi:nitroreductase